MIQSYLYIVGKKGQNLKKKNYYIFWKKVSKISSLM